MPGACVSPRHLPAWRTVVAVEALCLRSHRSLSTQAREAYSMQFLASPDTLRDQAVKASEICERCIALLPAAVNNSRLTLQILDTMSNQLCLVMDAAEFVRNLHPSEAHHQSAMDSFLRLGEYMNTLNTSKDLHAAICSINPDGLTAEELRCCQVFRQDMEANGIALPDSVRGSVARLRTEIEELCGDVIAAKAASTNTTIMALMHKRQELATTLQEQSFSHNALRNTIAGSPDAVWRFLTGLATRLAPQVANDVRTLRHVKYDGLSRIRRLGTTPDAVDITDREIPDLINRFYSDQKVDRGAVREFLPFKTCWAGLLRLCHRVFGVQFIEVPLDPFEAWHPSVRKLAVQHDRLGFLGVLYADLFARKGKLASAGHLTVQGGCRVHGEVFQQLGVPIPPVSQPAVLVLTTLIQPEEGGNPLLWPHEVETLFHEMGHALHTFCGHTTYQNLTGTRTSVDFAEFPSQFLEHFARDFRVLSTFAQHYKSGQALPEEAFRAAFSQPFTGVTTLSEVMQASMDQLLHAPPPYTIPFPTGALRLEAQDPTAASAELGRYYVDLAPQQGGKGLTLTASPLGSVEHFINYPALYYSYLYSKAFSRRTWGRFFAADPFDPKEGDRFRAEVLAHGAARDPKTILADYLGEVPDPSEFLEEFDTRS